jgi:hypothetical protein
MNVQYPLAGKTHKEQFSALIKVLAKKFKPLYIYCFAQFVESSYKSGCLIEKSADKTCRYYLLLITESATRIEHEAQNYANEHNLLVDGSSPSWPTSKEPFFNKKNGSFVLTRLVIDFEYLTLF